MKKIYTFAHYFMEELWVKFLFFNLGIMICLIYYCEPNTYVAFYGIDSTVLMLTFFSYLFPLLIRTSKKKSPKFKDLTRNQQEGKYFVVFAFPLLVTFSNFIELFVLLMTKDVIHIGLYLPNIILIISFFRALIVLEEYVNESI